jgi:hypothetical protein
MYEIFFFYSCLLENPLQGGVACGSIRTECIKHVWLPTFTNRVTRINKGGCACACVCGVL